MRPPDSIHVAVIGAGAAGLATAIFTRRLRSDVHVALLDGARTPGAKILVSGGSRCNVTNRTVTAADFNGGRPGAIARVLAGFSAGDAVAFFRDIGVPLHEEPGGKMFPDSNRSRDVLQALLSEAGRAGVRMITGCRVSAITRTPSGFLIATTEGDLRAAAVVLATGGLSLPKTGSDGAGYRLATELGHSLVPTTPALVPLTLTSEDGVPEALTGVALPVRLDLRLDGRIATVITGPLLWTHFGISGPAALDVSRHWLRAQIGGRPAGLSASFASADDFESLESGWVALASARPRLAVQTAVASKVPAAMAAALLRRATIASDQRLATLTREERRALVHALVAWPMPVTGSRGYNYAEVTAGGIPLAEVSPATMASRLCSGLYFAGEILDVDGRLGGFNFQWAWSSGRRAAEGLASLIGSQGLTMGRS